MHMQGQPLYPPKSVRFHFASSLQQLECTAGESPSACCHFCTAEYPVENSDTLQRFSIPPTLCIGGFVRVSVVITLFSLLFKLILNLDKGTASVSGQYSLDHLLGPICGSYAMLCLGCMPHERSATACMTRKCVVLTYWRLRFASCWHLSSTVFCVAQHHVFRHCS